MQGFNEEIEKSKKNFTDARKYIPVIKRLIRSALKSANEGKVSVDMSSQAAKTARSIFEEANKTLASSKKVSN